MNQYASWDDWNFLFTKPFIQHLPTKLQTWLTRGTALKPINVLMKTGTITKTGTIDTTFHKPAGEANMYVRFGYSPLKVFYHTQGQVSWPLNYYPMNMIQKSQQSTKYGLDGDFEGYKNFYWFNYSSRNQ